MSNTYKHKENGKFNNQVIDLQDISENVRHEWDRNNYHSGKFRKKRNEIREKILKADEEN